MSMMEHLSELRTRLIFSLAAFLAVSVVAFVYFNQISDFLLEPLCSLPPENLGPNGCRLIFTSALEPVTVRLKVTAMTGIVLASPIWLYQVWAFIVPGLHPKEKKYALPFVVISIFLFLIGAVFAYVTLPSALDFLVSLGGDNLIPFFSANDYLSFIGLVILVFGVTFEAPLLLFFLGLVGVVTVDSCAGSAGWRSSASRSSAGRGDAQPGPVHDACDGPAPVPLLRGDDPRPVFRGQEACQETSQALAPPGLGIILDRWPSKGRRSLRAGGARGPGVRLPRLVRLRPHAARRPGGAPGMGCSSAGYSLSWLSGWSCGWS